MQMRILDTLCYFYKPTPQRKSPMLRKQSQKCALFAAIARYIVIIFTIGYLQIFNAGYFFSLKYCQGL